MTSHLARQSIVADHDISEKLERIRPILPFIEAARGTSLAASNFLIAIMYRTQADEVRFTYQVSHLVRRRSALLVQTCRSKSENGFRSVHLALVSDFSPSMFIATPS